MKRLSCKKGNFSIHENITFFRKKEQGLDFDRVSNIGSKIFHGYIMMKDRLILLISTLQLADTFGEFYLLIRSVRYLESRHFCLFLVQQRFLVTFQLLKRLQFGLAGSLQTNEIQYIIYIHNIYIYTRHSTLLCHQERRKQRNRIWFGNFLSG